MSDCELQIFVSGSHKLQACRLAWRKLPSDSLQLITGLCKNKVTLIDLCVYSLTLRRPLLSYGYSSYKASCARLG